jgi:hypothetical protein
MYQSHRRQEKVLYAEPAGEQQLSMKTTGPATALVRDSFFAVRRPSHRYPARMGMPGDDATRPWMSLTGRELSGGHPFADGPWVISRDALQSEAAQNTETARRIRNTPTHSSRYRTARQPVLNYIARWGSFSRQREIRLRRNHVLKDTRVRV